MTREKGDKWQTDRHTDTQTDRHTHTYAHTHLYTHTHTHTHTLTHTISSDTDFLKCVLSEPFYFTCASLVVLFRCYSSSCRFIQSAAAAAGIKVKNFTQNISVPSKIFCSLLTVVKFVLPHFFVFFSPFWHQLMNHLHGCCSLYFLLLCKTM